MDSKGKAAYKGPGKKLKPSKMPSPPASCKKQVKKVVVCNDEASGSQALYVEGVYIGSDSAIYAHDIVTAVGGSDVPFTLEQRNFIEIVDENEYWPSMLANVTER